MELPISPAGIPGNFVAMASDLNWPPGKWPSVINFCDQKWKNIGPIVDPGSREILAFLYVSDDDKNSITVFND